MSDQNTFGSLKVATVGLVLVGIITLVVSTFYFSSFFAIVGFSLVFWGTILLYVIPTKNNLELLVSAASQPALANIERILSQNGLFNNGIYLSTEFINSNPGFFKKLEALEKSGSTIIFVPEGISTSEDSDYQRGVSLKNGVYFTPPGGTLCELFEQEIGKSFSHVPLKEFEATLKKVLVKKLKLGESVGMQLEENTVKVEVIKSLFERTCRETDKLPQTHKQVGCLLSSAIACALAKVLGQPVIIENETRNSHAKNMQITYQYAANVQG